jgi:hypothetical protein
LRGSLEGGGRDEAVIASADDPGVDILRGSPPVELEQDRATA